MNDKVSVTVNTDNVWVRFESIGDRKRFNSVLSAFRDAFPLTVWDDQRRAWRLPVGWLSNVIAFGENFLGKHSVNVQGEATTTTVIRQETLL